MAPTNTGASPFRSDEFGPPLGSYCLNTIPRKRRPSMKEFEPLVLSSVGEPAEMPDSEPRPTYYFDARGIKRLFMKRS